MRYMIKASFVFSLAMIIHKLIFSVLIKTPWNISHSLWFNLLLWPLSIQNGRQSAFRFGLRLDSFMLLDITLVIQKKEWEESLDTLDFSECSFTIYTLDINLFSIRKCCRAIKVALQLNFKINFSIISLYYTNGHSEQSFVTTIPSITSRWSFHRLTLIILALIHSLSNK